MPANNGMPDFINMLRQLFIAAAQSPEKLASVPDMGGVPFEVDPETALKGAARVVFAELLQSEPQKWGQVWFLIQPGYLRLFRFEEAFKEGENQRWLMLLYLKFCQDFPDFAPVTPVTPLDDAL